MAEEQEFNSTLDEFAAKLDEFRRVKNALQAKSGAANADPQLRAEYDQLMSRAAYIDGLIQKAQDAAQWVQYQIQQAQSAVDGLGNVGFLPIVAWGVAIAALTGAIAAMSYWLSGAYEWTKRAEIANRVADSGGSPAEIAEALQAHSGILSSGIGSLVVLGLFAFAMYKGMQ